MTSTETAFVAALPLWLAERGTVEVHPDSPLLRSKAVRLRTSGGHTTYAVPIAHRHPAGANARELILSAADYAALGISLRRQTTIQISPAHVPSTCSFPPEAVRIVVAPSTVHVPAFQQVTPSRTMVRAGDHFVANNQTVTFLYAEVAEVLEKDIVKLKKIPAVFLCGPEDLDPDNVERY